uniref:Uncharacterized protein n=1 Tax=Podarcis muralis TaxID=64176 RepID=A0A670JNM7_PODMU
MPPNFAALPEMRFLTKRIWPVVRDSQKRIIYLAQKLSALWCFRRLSQNRCVLTKRYVTCKHYYRGFVEPRGLQPLCQGLAG